VRRRRAAVALAIVIAASPAVVAADVTAPAAVVRALAARAAVAEREPTPAAFAPKPAVAATAFARVWPVDSAERVDGDPAAPGLRLRVPPAAAVRAPAAGRVVFADRIDRLGLVLITSHGDEYHSVLAGLASTDVGVGSCLTAGDRVGRMADHTESGLEVHVELRHHGRPVDPLPWLGVNSAGDGPS
jgi:murein DD-endopeptidase MepM/ murein hydrolase activator NlpD